MISGGTFGSSGYLSRAAAAASSSRGVARGAENNNKAPPPRRRGGFAPPPRRATPRANRARRGTAAGSSGGRGATRGATTATDAIGRARVTARGGVGDASDAFDDGSLFIIVSTLLLRHDRQIYFACGSRAHTHTHNRAARPVERRSSRRTERRSNAPPSSPSVSDVYDRRRALGFVRPRGAALPSPASNVRRSREFASIRSDRHGCARHRASPFRRRSRRRTVDPFGYLVYSHPTAASTRTTSLTLSPSLSSHQPPPRRARERRLGRFRGGRRSVPRRRGPRRAPRRRGGRRGRGGRGDPRHREGDESRPDAGRRARVGRRRRRKIRAQGAQRVRPAHLRDRTSACASASVPRGERHEEHQEGEPRRPRENWEVAKTTPFAELPESRGDSGWSATHPDWTLEDLRKAFEAANDAQNDVVGVDARLPRRAQGQAGRVGSAGIRRGDARGSRGVEGVAEAQADGQDVRRRGR